MKGKTCGVICEIVDSEIFPLKGGQFVMNIPFVK